MPSLLSGTLVMGLAAAVAWGATRLLIPLMARQGVVDVPNERSSHDAPRPRGGGLGIVAGAAAGTVAAWALGMPLPGPAFFAGAGLVALAGFADDRLGGLPALVRLVLQVIAAGLVVAVAGGLERLPLPVPLDVPLGVLGPPLAVVWIVGVTNLYNFLDGIDGYAAMQGIVAGIGLALLGTLSPPLVFGLVLAGGCLGFLGHNWQPARIFMGDVGAYTLGFALAALPFEVAPADGRSAAVLATVLCLWFFLADGAYTLVRRLLRGERVWQAHRSHLYQRLVQTGLTHSQVVVRVGAAAVGLAGLGVAAAQDGGAAVQWVALLGALGAFAAYVGLVRRRENQARAASTETPL